MFPQVNPSAKSKKLLTKFALAKKLAKKNIQVNTKVVFDDEGKVSPAGLLWNIGDGFFKKITMGLFTI